MQERYLYDGYSAGGEATEASGMTFSVSVMYSGDAEGAYKTAQLVVVEDKLHGA